MSRTVMFLVLMSCVAVGAAAASIVTYGHVPSFSLFETSSATRGPLANRDNKADRLSVAALRLRDSTEQMQDAPPISEPLRLAFASDSPIINAAINRSLNAPITIPPSAPPQKPKLVARPAPQKTYTLLSDMQIAGIKDRLKLTPSQESYWPGVESALRAIAQKIHSKKQTSPAGNSPPIDPESAEVAQLKTAAMPLLFQLREDQKREVRALARIIGLEAVASRI